MNNSVQSIELLSLLYITLPTLVTLYVLWRWSLRTGNAIHALLRMLVQLLIVGYFLAYLFESHNAWIVLAVLLVMVLASSWIALGTVAGLRVQLFRHALLAILIGGGLSFALVILAVLQLEPWYRPQYSIPLAGMIFANAMSVPHHHSCNLQRIGKRLAARHGSQVLATPLPRAITQRMSTFRLARREHT